MNGSTLPKNTISSGVADLDALIDGYSIGDNVVWEVEAGTAYSAFIRNFIARSFKDNEKVIYVNFNRSPQTVLNDLSALMPAEHFTLIDSFTSGKGKNDNTFLKFYEKQDPRVVRIEEPRDIDRFTATLNAIEDKLPPGARYVFDSLTGMQDSGAMRMSRTVSSPTCARVVRPRHRGILDTGERGAQPAVQGKPAAHYPGCIRPFKTEEQPFPQSAETGGQAGPGGIQIPSIRCPRRYGDDRLAEEGIGFRHRIKLKEERMRIGMSQKELADKVGLTPSFLSQLEKRPDQPVTQYVSAALPRDGCQSRPVS